LLTVDEMLATRPLPEICTQGSKNCQQKIWANWLKAPSKTAASPLTKMLELGLLRVTLLG